MMLKPRNLRVIILTLIVATLIVAIYHLYYGGGYGYLPDPKPTQVAPIDNLIGVEERDHPSVEIVLGEAGSHNNEVNVSPINRGTLYKQQTHRSRHHNLARGFNFTLSPEGQRRPSGMSNGKCFKIDPFIPDIDTWKVYPNLEFEAEWIRTREYWNPVYEKRYKGIKQNDNKKERARPSHNLPQAPSLKVFVIPHSHNDPGWLKTFEGYFYAQTKEILDNVVEKLTELTHMKFLWSEISFLSKWWEHAHPTKREMLQELVKAGRLEIVTGGWVMTDEATVNLYSMIDQLVEGHQWVKAHFGIVPKSSWSVDPFGHGSVLPYILQASNIKGMVIQVSS